MAEVKQENTKYIVQFTEFGYGLAVMDGDKAKVILPRHVSNTPKLETMFVIERDKHNMTFPAFFARVDIHTQSWIIKELPFEIIVVVYDSGVVVSGVPVEHIDLVATFEQGKLVYFAQE